jgi:hypothetical protein
MAFSPWDFQPERFCHDPDGLPFGSTEWAASALFAMGRSASEDWFADVLFPGK